MKTVIVNIPEKKENYFLSLFKENRIRARVLTNEDKEDHALLAIMYERENEETVPVETTLRILNKIIKK